MSARGVGEISVRTNRPPATRTWTVEHRWGQLIGDTRTLAVTRSADGRLYMSYGKESLEIRKDLLDTFVEMVNEAHRWTDEPEEMETVHHD